MFVMCCLMTAPAFAARNCPTTEKLELQGNQKASSPEFVYTSSSVRDEVDACRKAYNKDKSEGKVCKISKEVYECDKEQACDNGTYLLGQAGWVNGQGASVAGKILECNTMTIKNSDRWAEYAYTSCPSNMDSSWVEIPIFNKTSMKCFKGTTTYDLDTHRYTGHDLRYNVPAYCCKDGKQNEMDVKPVDSGGDENADANNVGQVPPKETALQRCLQERRGNTEGMACCYLKADVATYNKQTGKCECIAGKFDIQDGRGKCIPISNNNDGEDQGHSGGSEEVPVETPELYACPTLDSSLRVTYKSCEGFVQAFDELELYCVSSNRKEDGYMSRYSNLQQLRSKCDKAEADKKLRITKSTAIISNASQKLDDIMAGLKVSVWKNAEGKFNTARLASDSIAGVVLGTAGGLITSHLVKKNQVKTGFEDIQCTVGGQKVADWGDEFMVGIR